MLAGLAVLLVAGAAPAPAADAAGCVDADLGIASGQTERLRAATVCLVNASRRANGLPTLGRDAELQQASQRHTDDMVNRRYFEHEAPPPAPRTSAERASASGYAWSWVSENLAAGLPTPRATVDSWLRSPGHCVNMLSSRPLDVGIGIRPEPPEGSYAPGTWTMTVARKAGVAAPVTGDGACPSQLPASVGGSPAPAPGAGNGSSLGGSAGSGPTGSGSASTGAVPQTAAATLGGGLRFVTAPTQRRGARLVTARVRCARPSGVCRSLVFVTHRAGGKVVRLARRVLALRAGRTITLRTTLTAPARRRLGRARSIDALLSFRAAGSAVLGRRVLLRAR